MTSRGPALSLSNGFTLFEILIVMAIMVTVMGFSLFMSMDSFRGGSFRSDRDLLVALLQHARSQAMNNICANSSCTDGSGHGVYVDAANHTFTVYEGSSYASRNQVQDQTFQESPATTNSLDTEIDFTQLDGTVSATKSFKLDGAGKTSTITVDPSGRISWTN